MSMVVFLGNWAYTLFMTTGYNYGFLEVKIQKI